MIRAGEDATASGSERRGFRPVAARLTRDEAHQRLRRPRWRPSRGRISGIEIVRVPTYVLATAVHGERGRGSPEVRFCVDAMIGAVTRLAPDAVFPSAPDEPHAPEVVARLPESSVLGRAREEIPWIALAFALRRRRAYRCEEFRVVDRIGHPHWVLHEIAGARRRIRALDALSGAAVGSRRRRAIVEVILAESNPPSSEPRAIAEEGEDDALGEAQVRTETTGKRV